MTDSRVGFHRAYRRLLEGVKSKNLPRDKEELIRSAIKQSMRFPSEAYKHLSQSDVAAFLTENGVAILNRSNMPFFFKTLADIVSQPRAFGGSIMDMLKNYVNKK